MASARQRRRKSTRRAQHVRVQRLRLRAALATIPTPCTMTEVRRHMGEWGFEPDGLGGWYATRHGRPPRSAAARTTWEGITAKRKAKKRRKRG